MGKVILVSVISTTAVVFSLTLYTFWAARRGHDFSFLGPFLYGSLFCFHWISCHIYLWVSWSYYIFWLHCVYDTYNLIERFSYDQYILASVSLYLDIINLFLYMLTIFSDDD
ncbi:hypothetical protein MtrunA17_Chr7g0260251 [Medicago truncatula]|uniref:Transmembrane protein n=1 Tax=Medicago truncatula TaxID=3880 RepID=A0A396H8N4_MEDTR|nr:hypothetical protein MtrunA17_Chr7g0260251 [Medicago truncatula]